MYNRHLASLCLAILASAIMMQKVVGNGGKTAANFNSTNTPSGCAPEKINGCHFKDERDRAGYAFGMNIGRGLKEGQVDLNPEAIARGLRDSMAGRTPLLTEAEMRETLAQFGRDLRVLQQQRRDQLAEKNRRDGEAFLAQNKTRPGVITLPSGLQYKIIATGSGPSPDLTNWVALKFRGTHINGAEFESSDSHPESNIFSLRSVIQGWADALQIMKPGAKWQLFVPPSLAYGKEGAPNVGPNETLIYDLELVSILPGQPQPTPADIKNERESDGD